MNLLDAVREIVHAQRAIDVPTELAEEAASSRCEPISLEYSGEAWALRLRDGDFLPILAELPKERSVRRLPDFLVFSNPLHSAHRKEDETLQVLVCELKSSATGAKSALPQLRLGKLLADYLTRVAAYSLGWSEVPKTWCCGLIVSPDFPAQMNAKGKTRPGKLELPNMMDDLSRMRLYITSGGAHIHLESFY